MPKVKYKKNGDWNDLDFSSGGSGSASIDDTNTSVDKTWSSDKINKQFQTIMYIYTPLYTLTHTKMCIPL